MSEIDFYEVKRVAINASSSGNNTLVSAVSGKKIRVTAMMIIAAGAVNVNIQSGASGTTLSGLITIDAATKGFVVPPNSNGWCQTAASTLLNMNLSTGVQVSGFLNYIEVP